MSAASTPPHSSVTITGASFVALLLALALGGAAVQGLWNVLVPALFNGPAVSFWQALGLLVLTRILFGARPWPPAAPTKARSRSN